MHDVEDVESFVRAMIPKTRLKRLSFEDREELLAEGIAILCRMATKYKSRMDGYEQDGSFAGYCAKYLPHKMREAWYSWHPEHLLEWQEDGKRRHTHGESPASWDEKLERDNELDSNSLRFIGDFVRSR